MDRRDQLGGAYVQSLILNTKPKLNIQIKSILNKWKAQEFIG